MSERKCRQLVTTRSDELCERCCRAGTTMHHRKKRSQGGPWCPTNVVALCGHGTVGCHGWVEHNPNAAAEQGWHVRPWQDPADVPVLYRGSDWVRLTIEGSYVPADNRDPDADIPE